MLMSWLFGTQAQVGFLLVPSNKGLPVMDIAMTL